MKTFTEWWFIAGGGIHAAWKYRKWGELRKLAESLPRAAWDIQETRINELEAKLKIATEALSGIIGAWDAQTGGVQVSIVLRQRIIKAREALEAMK